MADHPDIDDDGPGTAEIAVSALQAWVGDWLADRGNPLHRPLAVHVGNRPVAPEDLPAPANGRVAVLVHGLGCTEGLWRWPAAAGEPRCGGYGALLAERHGFVALHVRYNSGLRVSANGAALHGVLERYVARHGDAVREIVGIGHSMGGLVFRSACHAGRHTGWTSLVRHGIYLGSPHLGAPLERFANAAGHVLGAVDVTATRVIRDLLGTRSGGVKDLRYGNLVEDDWLPWDPDALLENRRVPLPWLEGARHHRVVGRALPLAPFLGDGMVPASSAAAEATPGQPGAPGPDDVVVLDGVPHLTLARDPRVWARI